MDKKAKISTTFFVGLMMLAFMGLAIMNSQLEAANQMTASAVGEKDWQPFTLSVFALVGIVMAVFIVATYSKGAMARRHVHDINKDIQKLENSLKELER